MQKRLTIRSAPPGRPAARRGGAFTLIELLVVISILVLLIALLLPALGKSREMSIRTTCARRVNQITVACLTYANDNDGRFPYREPGGYMPHRVYIPGKFDLTTLFAQPYLVDRLQGMFCPGRLFEVRNPDVYGAYVYDYVSYQYMNYESPGAVWRVPKPDLSRVGMAEGGYSLWGCVTTLKPGGNYLAHDIAEQALTPTGLNAAKLDGSAGWTVWEDCENWVLSEGHEWWWPRR